jgi:hypothetical protein
VKNWKEKQKMPPTMCTSNYKCLLQFCPLTIAWFIFQQLFQSFELFLSLSLAPICLINFYLYIQWLLNVDFMAHKAGFLDERLIWEENVRNSPRNPHCVGSFTILFTHPSPTFIHLYAQTANSNRTKIRKKSGARENEGNYYVNNLNCISSEKWVPPQTSTTTMKEITVKMRERESDEWNDMGRKISVAQLKMLKELNIK